MTSRWQHLGRWAGIASMVAASGFAVALPAAPAGATNKAHRSAKAAKGALNEAIVIAYTGPVSFEGAAADAGVYPAIDEINAAGGILGHKVNVVPVDTKGDPADAVPQVDKLIATTSHIIGVAGVGTASAPTIVPILNSAHLPMFAFAGEAAFDHSKYKYFWRLLPPDDAVGKAMDLYAHQEGYKKVALVFGTTTGAQSNLPGILAGMKPTHEKLVAKITVTPEQPSYRAEVEKLVAAHPQVILTEMDTATSVTFFSELKQLGHMLPIIGTNTEVTSTWENAVRKALGTSTFNKDIRVLDTVAANKSPATAAYAKALKLAKSKVVAPWTGWVGNSHSQAAYDAVVVQALAMTASHSVTPKVYNNHIMTVTQKGSGKKVVYTYPNGVKLLKAGKKIQYVGAGGPINFDKWHNSFGNMEAVKINAKDNTVPVKTIFEKAILKIG